MASTPQIVNPFPEVFPDLVDEERTELDTSRIGLCLSGGGYRAMLFHAGALIRMNEMGILPKLGRVSSVSGGSITAALLGLNWRKLAFDDTGSASNLAEHLVNPLREMASQTIDRGSILGGVLLPGSVSDRVIAHYKSVLFGDATLQQLPSDAEGPRFVITATNVQSGALVRMSRPYLADYRVGMIRNPTISLASAVAASSAFPPFLSPAEIDIDPTDFVPDKRCDLQREPYTDTLVLTDGGVYDNLGIEPVWKNYKTVLVSDGSGKMQADPDPAGDWARHSKRILDIVDNQVRSLRKRQLVDSFVSGLRDGAYWGIRTDISRFGLGDTLNAPFERTTEIADSPTRLKRMPDTQQDRIMNWGYAVCDAALRRHATTLSVNSVPPVRFPFAAGVS